MGAITISCMLEGPPQRAFLAVAEARTVAPHRAGFTTLSSSLGQVGGGLGYLAESTLPSHDRHMNAMLLNIPILYAFILL